MNSTAVNRRIRALVWPILRDHGFEAFTARSAWRQHDAGIGVVNFQSFNRYHADVIGCSTYSFAVNLGVFVAGVPSDHPLPTRGGMPCPEEYACHIRRRLHSSLPTLPSYPDVWLMGEDDAESEATVQAATLVLVETALPWFEAFRDRRAVLEMLRDERSPPDELTNLAGNTDSPTRHIVAGYLALTIGADEQGATHLRQALAKLRAFDAQNASLRSGMRSIVPQHLQATVDGLDK